MKNSQTFLFTAWAFLLKQKININYSDPGPRREEPRQSPGLTE